MKHSCTNCGLDQEANDGFICVRCGETRLVEAPLVAAFYGYSWKDYLPARWVELNNKIDRVIKEKKPVTLHKRAGNL